MSFTWFGLYCGLMLSISAFSIDILLPAFVDISTGLAVPMQQVQLTVSAYVVGLGLAHPVFGLLSDSKGRKNAIYTGLVIYLIGSLVVTASSQINAILLGRVIQGLGAAAAPVVCRAMIRDKFSGRALAQHMAIASMFFAVGPMLAPLLGHFINSTFGWRAVFGFLLVFGLFLLLATTTQPETLPISSRKRISLASVWGAIAAVFRHPQSRFFILASGLATGLILSFLAQAPVIYELELGAASGSFATLFAMAATGIIVGQLINHRLIAAVGTVIAALLAAGLLVLTTSAIAIGSSSGWITAGIFTALIFLFNVAYLIVYSNFASLALDPHSARAGMAAAMFGLIGYVVGATLAALMAWLSMGELVRWSLYFVALTTLLLLCIAWWWYHGRRVHR